MGKLVVGMIIAVLALSACGPRKGYRPEGEPPAQSQAPAPADPEPAQEGAEAPVESAAASGAESATAPEADSGAAPEAGTGAESAAAAAPEAGSAAGTQAASAEAAPAAAGSEAAPEVASAQSAPPEAVPAAAPTPDQGWPEHLAPANEREAQIANLIRSDFDKYDGNRSGTLDQAEFARLEQDAVGAPSRPAIAPPAEPISNREVVGLAPKAPPGLEPQITLEEKSAEAADDGDEADDEEDSEPVRHYSRPRAEYARPMN